MKTLASVLVTLLGLAVFSAYGQSDSTKTQQQGTITLQIEEITCELCPRSLKSSLEKLESIAAIHKIDPQKGFAKLTFKNGKIPTDKILKGWKMPVLS